MNQQGSSTPGGSLGLRVIRSNGSVEDVGSTLHVPDRPGDLACRDIIHLGLPRRGLSDEVNEWRTRNFRHLWRGVRRQQVARILRLPTFYGALYLKVIRTNGQEVDLGLASLRVVTTAGVGYLIDALQNITEAENLKFHGLGTGTTAEASSDTALVTELTTQYNPDNTRATGSTTEGASANIYRTVGTVTVDAAVAATEHGVFSQAATGGGVLLDRSVFAVVNLASGDSLQATYEWTLPAGG